MVDYVPAIIGLYAVPLMCDYIDQELNRWAQRRNKQAAVTSEERAMTKRERRLKVAHSILRGNEVIPEDEQTGDVLKGAIHQFRSLFQEKNALAAYLNQLQAEVNYDLSRIYRYRNRLVHEAVQANEIAYRLVDRLACVRRIFLANHQRCHAFGVYGEATTCLKYGGVGQSRVTELTARCRGLGSVC